MALARVRVRARVRARVGGYGEGWFGAGWLGAGNEYRPPCPSRFVVLMSFTYAWERK